MTPQEMVLEFHRAFDCSVDDRSPETTEQRLELVDEEYSELLDELLDWHGDTGSDWGQPRQSEDIDWPAVAKELADLVYVLYGAAVNWGIDLDRAVEIVHKSNMGKLWEDGRPRYALGGKVLKPPNYEAPDMREVVKDL